MKKLLIGSTAIVLLAGVTIATAQTSAPSNPSGTTTREEVPAKGAIGVGTPPTASQSGTKAEQPPEGEEGTRRPGQQAPAGNAPVAR